MRKKNREGEGSCVQKNSKFAKQIKNVKEKDHKFVGKKHKLAKQICKKTSNL